MTLVPASSSRSSGGGSLPSQWTVGPNGAAVFAPTDPGMTGDQFPLVLRAPTDTPALILENDAASGDASVALQIGFNTDPETYGNVFFADGTMNLYPKPTATRSVLVVGDTNGDTKIEVSADGHVGFFGKTPATQPAAPTTLGDVIAALKTLGLVAT